ncbi:MAG TPA: hypothetical protein VMZ28_04795 [Kofleriaceae bacterium]|nr:hypothetical protein [Kofleriaceae bacterium]
MRPGWRGVVVLAAALAAPACKGDDKKPAAAPPAPAPPVATPVKDAGAVATPPATPAVPAGTHGPCTAEQVKTARAESKALFDQKAFQPAADRLAELLSSCSLDNADDSGTHPNLDFYWVHSDLALALHRAGDHAGCMGVLAPLTTPRPPLSIYLYDLEEEKVGKALLHNEELCRKAHEGTRKDFAAAPCPFKTDGQAAALLGDTCLVLGPAGDPGEFQQALDNDVGRDESALCPSVSAFTQKPGAEPVETLLEPADGPLTDISNCCNLTEISTATRDGKRLVRIRGGGRDCFGGTADMDIDSIYEWTGDTLKLVDDTSVSSH